MTREAPQTVRLPIVGVMGSGTDPHPDLAEPLGRWLATQSVHLLTGGGAGVMECVSRAFCETPGRSGRTIGILPHSSVAGIDAAGEHAAGREAGRQTRREAGRSGEAHAGYPNPWIEIPIFTHLSFTGFRGTDPLSRNHINVLSSDVIVALPGSSGTASEIVLARQYGRPLIAFLHRAGEMPRLPAETRWTSNLEEVKRFVSESLRERGRPTMRQAHDS